LELAFDSWYPSEGKKEQVGLTLGMSERLPWMMRNSLFETSLVILKNLNHLLRIMIKTH